MTKHGRSGHGSTGGSSRRSGHGPKPSAERRATGGPRSGDLTAYRARLTEVIEPVTRVAGYDLEDLSVVRMGRRHVVRVTVDRDGGVGLDAVAELSRDISERLDAAEASGGEFIAGEYQLEVSSPGTDRPLTEPRHWRRNVGRLATVKLDGHPVTGRIVAADDAGVTLAVDGVETTHAYGDLGRGHIEVEFGRLAELDDDFGEDDPGGDDDLIALADDGADGGEAGADDGAAGSDVDDAGAHDGDLAPHTRPSGDDQRADGAGIDDDDMEDTETTYDAGEEDVR